MTMQIEKDSSAPTVITGLSTAINKGSAMQKMLARPLRLPRCWIRQ
jgi:hypothetical protein